MLRKILKSKMLKGLILIFLSIILILFIIDKIISFKSENYIYNQTQNIPYNRVGLLLGTSKKLNNGWNNLYFSYRIQAAKQLYDAGKVHIFVVSGDNSRKEYNEAQDMKDDLIALGIPSDSIYLDFAGFRTLDSVVRMKEIFGQNKFTIISQKFHNERAILIARHYNLDVVGFNAKDVNSYYGFKTMAREKLARVKVFLDFLTGKKPKYLGDKIQI